MKPIRLTKHAREQCLERGATEDEVVEAIRNGTREPAKLGRELCRFNFSFSKKWQGNYYEFANVQIRIFGRDRATQQKLWFAAPDILKVLAEKPSRKLELIYGPAEYWVFPEENVAVFRGRRQKMPCRQPTSASKRDALMD